MSCHSCGSDLGRTEPCYECTRQFEDDPFYLAEDRDQARAIARLFYHFTKTGCPAERQRFRRELDRLCGGTERPKWLTEECRWLNPS